MGEDRPFTLGGWWRHRIRRWLFLGAPIGSVASHRRCDCLCGGGVCWWDGRLPPSIQDRRYATVRSGPVPSRSRKSRSARTGCQVVVFRASDQLARRTSTRLRQTGNDDRGLRGRGRELSLLRPWVGSRPSSGRRLASAHSPLTDRRPNDHVEHTGKAPPRSRFTM